MRVSSSFHWAFFSVVWFVVFVLMLYSHIRVVLFATTVLSLSFCCCCCFVADWHCKRLVVGVVLFFISLRIGAYVITAHNAQCQFMSMWVTECADESSPTIRIMDTPSNMIHVNNSCNQLAFRYIRGGYRPHTTIHISTHSNAEDVVSHVFIATMILEKYIPEKEER